jgi:catechol 2,3-dioxygenase-like lactoylglutathione lyase family enzyme
MTKRMIDHVDIRAADVDASKRFYDAVLAPFGYAAVSDKLDPAGGREVMFGDDETASFAIHSPVAATGQDTVTTGAHIAFCADDERTVDAFHAAAVAVGAPSIGDPGTRPEYSERYYGAFVLDPDGNNVEAVYHRPG